MKLNHQNLNARSKCSIACTLDIIGDKWTLLIIRDALYLEKTSFNEFRYSPEKIASNILTNRLEKLVHWGIMSKTKNATNKLKFDYILTERGEQLKPILLALGKWGKDSIEGTNDVLKEAEKYKQSRKN